MRLALTITWCIVVLTLIAAAIAAALDLPAGRWPDNSAAFCAALVLVWFVFLDDMRGGASQ